jgi:hypothetical protein
MEEKLPWNFEAFRKFITYEALQQAASTLTLFEGVNYTIESEKNNELSKRLGVRTDLEWVPDRKVSEAINYDIEGSLFRNKARVLTSLYILDPLALQMHSTIKVTPFGKALGSGLISKNEFYKEIIFRFEYPHPAYEDNWTKWTEAGKSLFPLLFIIEVLIELIKSGEENNYLEIAELATYGFLNAANGEVKKAAKNILMARSDGLADAAPRTDDVNRKIGDMFGFLCISGFCFYKKRGICLNLLGVSTDDGCHYWLKRGPDSVIENWCEEIKKRFRLHRKT